MRNNKNRMVKLWQGFMVAVLIAAVPNVQVFSSSSKQDLTPRVLNLTISLYRDSVNDQTREKYEEIIRNFADGVYEASNGAHRLGRVKIYTSSRSSIKADILWTENCNPNAMVNGRVIPGFHINMCDNFSGLNFLANAEGYAKGGYTLTHEWGHYFYGLYDEYQSRSTANDQVAMQPHSTDEPVIASVMNNQFNAYAGKFDWLNFSTEKNINPRTAQYRMYNASAWGVFGQLPPWDLLKRKAWLALPVRLMHPNLLQVVPAEEEKPRIDLPAAGVSDQSRQALEIVWVNDQTLQIVIDHSGSMNGEKLENAKLAAKLLVQLAELKFSRVGVIQFNEQVQVVQPLIKIESEQDKSQVYSSIYQIEANGGTAIGVAAQKALDDLISSDVSQEDSAVFLLTDGRNESGFNPLNVVGDYVSAGVPIYTLGYGSDVNRDVLEQMALATGGEYFFSDISLSALISSFQDAVQYISPNSIDLQMSTRSLDQGVVTDPFSYYLDPSLTQVNLVITHTGTPADAVFSVLDPAGQTLGELQCESSSGGTLCALNIDAQTGLWTLAEEVFRDNLEVTYRVTGNSNQQAFPITAAVNSLGGTNLRYPDPIVLLANLGSDLPIARANAVAVVQYPDGTQAEFPIKDDGIAPDAIADDGAYAALLDYQQNGNYQVTVYFDNQDGKAVKSFAGFAPSIGPDGESVPFPDPIPIQDNFKRIARLQLTVSDVRQDDHGNAASEATALAVDNTGVIGKIDYQGDLDVFSVRVIEGEGFSIRVSSLALGMDPRVKIFAADGQTILLNGDLQSHGAEEGYFLAALENLTSDGETLFVEISQVDGQSRGVYVISAGELLPGEQDLSGGGGFVSSKGGSGMLLVLAALLLGGALVVYVAKTRKKAGPHQSERQAFLLLSDGSQRSLYDGTIIGRGSGAGLRLTDPSISRQHARFRYADGSWFIQDLNSSGGTFLNDMKITAHKLNPGDLIRIGNHQFTFVIQ